MKELNSKLNSGRDFNHFSIEFVTQFNNKNELNILVTDFFIRQLIQVHTQLYNQLEHLNRKILNERY